MERLLRLITELHEVREEAAALLTEADHAIAAQMAHVSHLQNGAD